MSYKVEIRSLVRRKLTSWGLPDAVLVEAYLRLREKLSHDPWQQLRRTRHPFDGMEYRFSMVDPDNRFCEHVCYFQVAYSQDEEKLAIVNGGYLRRVGI